MFVFLVTCQYHKKSYWIFSRAISGTHALMCALVIYILTVIANRQFSSVIP
jgi:hypothetical protein